MNPRSLPLIRGWLSKAHPLLLPVLTIVLATLHAGQAVVFRDAIPGTLWDARLVNCTLEHVYQCLCGHGQFLSPGQFYPVPDTLVYSDNHFGDVLLYAPFRCLGASMESAFQGWILLVLVLNTASLLFLFRQLRIAPVLACPLALFGTSNTALVYKCLHPQVLPYFPFILCLAFICRFLKSAELKELAWAVIWFTYQNWCYLYHGYFTLLTVGGFTVVYLVGFARREFWQALARSWRSQWAWLLGTGFLSATALVVVYLPYVRYSAGVGTRAMSELVGLAPNVGAWFTASAYSFFYSGQQFYKAQAQPWGSTLFGGWMFWLLLPFLLRIAWLQRRQHFDARLALALLITVLALMAGMTTWAGSEANLYLWLTGKVASLRAFRAFTRVVYLLFVFQAVAVALILNFYYHRLTGLRWRNVAFGMLAWTLPLENLTLGQDAYLKSVAWQRGAALVEMWKKAGAREVLVFAPGYHNQGWEIPQVDCWQAALLLHKRTVNGYSGNYPPSHVAFLLAPTVPNAEALLARANVSREVCSLVTDWPEWAKRSLGIRTYQVRARIAPLTTATTLVLTPGQVGSVPITLRSDEGELDCDALHIFASYRLYKEDGEPIVSHLSPRTPVHVVQRGESPAPALQIHAPTTPGTYEARLSMVHEGVAWWADLNRPGSTVKLVVR